jgi:hypothetical protein
MLNAHIYYGLDVVIVQGVKDRFTLLTVLDEAGIFEDSELVGYCRHAHIKLFRNVANAHFALEKKVEDLYSCAVAHNREKFGKIEKMLVVGQLDFVQNFVMSLVLATDGSCVVPVFHFMPP